MWFVILSTTGLCSYFVYYLFNIPYPKGWKSTIRWRLLSVLLFNIHRLRNNLTRYLVPLGFSKAAITRAFLEEKPSKPLEDIEVTTEDWNGVPVSLFRVKGVEAKRGIVYFHGGGWVTGGLSSLLFSNMAKQSNAVILSPLYRKAPEYPFPAAFEDCYEVASRFIENAAVYGVDRERIALTGDSAGGNLAAAVTHKLCNDPRSPGKPALQYLLYPALQFSVYNLPSHLENREDPLLPGSLIDYAKVAYMGYSTDDNLSSAILNHGHLLENGNLDEELLTYVDVKKIPNRFKRDSLSGSFSLPATIKASGKLSEDERKEIKELMTNPLLSPLHASDEELKNLPKSYIMACGADPLCDEGILFYERLNQVGAEAHLVYLEKMPHGIFTFSKYSIPFTLDQEVDDICLNYFNTFREIL